MRQYDKQWKSPGLFLLVVSLGIIGHRLSSVLLPIQYLLIFCLLAFFLSRWNRLLIPATWLIFGFFWASLFATNLLNKSLPKELEKKDLTITGTVVSIPIHTTHYTRFDFLVENLSYQGVAYPSPGKVRLKVYDEQKDVKIAENWEFVVRLKRPHGYQNPGSKFNYETYLFAHRIRGTGYVRKEPSGKKLPKTRNSYVSVFRQEAFSFIQDHLSDAPHSGILTALLVGIRSAMKDHHWQIPQNTGTIHLVAISGLHVGLVFALVSWVTSRVWRLSGYCQGRMPANSWGVILGFLAAFLYALMAGMTIPTRRAITMLGVFVLAVLSHRRLSTYETMILMLTGVLLVDPLSPLSGSFWLSFGAVFAIVLCSSEMREVKIQGLAGKVLRQALNWSRVQLGIFMGMMPLLLLMFSQVSLVAPIANLIAVPVVGALVVPFALLGLTAFGFGLEYIALQFFEFSLWILSILWPALQWMSSIDGAVWQFSEKPVVVFVCAFVGVGWLFLPSVFLPRWLGVFWVLPIFSIQPSRLNQQEFRYTMLEVGHGLASVIETKNHVLVYDTGPGFSGGMNAGESVVNPFLISRGIMGVDKIILSHDHNDHVGGYDAIKARFVPLQTLAGVPAATRSSLPCYQGQSWSWDGVAFEVLWPPKGGQYEKNNASCVLRVSSVNGSLLLTGDIEKEAERKLVMEQSKKLQSDILQVPHQGSKTSSTEAFLNAVDPDLALLSTGYLNRFNHPHDVVSERYMKREIPMFNTAYKGAITVLFAEQRGVYWHREQLVGYWFFEN